MNRAATLAIRVLGSSLLALAAASSAHAQKLFKYQDSSGVWVYTDRQPEAGQSFEQTVLQRRFEQPVVRLFQRDRGGELALIAQSTYFGPVQLGFRLKQMENLARGAPREGLRMLPPRSETELFRAAKENPDVAMSFEYEFQFLPGDPKAVHNPDQPYRFPYALSSSFRVSQAYPENRTHTDPSSEHAIDFVMPIGTDVYAARGGVVIEVASDFFEAGLNRDRDGPRANVVRVLHDDGTMSLYAHLNWNSIRVVPGQRVARGEFLAESGNTGFSTGPHLHFVVQRNSGGQIVSLPVQFAGTGDGAVTVQTGETYTAH